MANIEGIAQKYGRDTNWNALRSQKDDLFAGLDPNANWNALRPFKETPPAPTAAPQADPPLTLPSAPKPGQVNPYGDPSGGASAESPASFGNPVYDQIGAYYRNLSGGAYTPTQQDVSQFGTNVDANYMNKIAAAIGQWWQADPRSQQPAAPAAPAATSPTSTDWSTVDANKIAQYFASRGVTPFATSVDYWVSKWPELVARGRELGDPEYAFKRLAAADEFGGGGGAAAAAPFRAPAPSAPASVAAPAAAVAGPAHGYDDPNAAFYLNEVMNRLTALKQPVKDPFEDILKLFAMMRVGDLSGAPYTAGEDAALTAHYRDPLTQSRDQAKEQKALELSRRGFTPDSGLFQSEMGKIDQAYERGIAQGSNALGVRAVDEKQRRADQQLAILSNLLSVNRSGVDRQNANADQVVQLAKMFPDFDAQRLDQLLRASGDGSGTASAMNSLTSLGSMNLNAANLQRLFQNDATQNSQQSAEAWGKILGYILGAL